MSLVDNEDVDFAHPPSPQMDEEVAAQPRPPLRVAGAGSAALSASQKELPATPAPAIPSGAAVPVTPLTNESPSGVRPFPSITAEFFILEGAQEEVAAFAFKGRAVYQGRCFRDECRSQARVSTLQQPSRRQEHPRQPQPYRVSSLEEG